MNRRRAGRKTILAATSIVAVALVATNPVVADAAKLVTGKDIKDSSVTTRDVKNGSLLAADFATGQVTPGATVPVGPTGPTGQPGAAGKSAPTPTVATWTIRHTQNGGTRVSGTSAMAIPAYTEVNGLDIRLTSGSLASCSESGNVAALIGGGAVAVAYSEGGVESLAVSQVNVGGQPIKLGWETVCYSTEGDFGGTLVPTPSFTAVVTFSMTQREATPSVTWE